uniref:hypothetical protein n=1 Tax=Streptomyces polyasparticus TaxID=2767826 RepID=UPI003F685BD6
MTTHAHVSHTPPPALSADDLAALRWEDDGGPVHAPHPSRTADQWPRVSAELGGRLPELAGREDVIVTCAPGTRSGAPAAFFPALAMLEIDADLFAPHPAASIRPAKPGDEERYPAAWGAFVHEAAHAAHSRWRIEDKLRGTTLDDAAQLLEESRAEAAHLARRPDDRRYLRACVTTVVLPDFTSRTLNTRWDAATAAGLLLARRDAGILDADEVDPLEQQAVALLGADVLADLAAIWKAAHATADTDAVGMTAHARAWCQVLGAEANQPPPRPGSGGGDGEPQGGGGSLAEAVRRTVGNIAEREEAEAAVRSARERRAAQKQAEAARTKAAAQAAKEIFTPGAGPYTPRRSATPPARKGRRQPPIARGPVARTRAPHPAEKAAAGQLARALRQAAYRERAVLQSQSAVPPGRLNMRGALARDAQRAAGATPTALPFTRTTRRQTSTPPLRVGIAVDVSGSMGTATAPMASAAWILAKATALTDPDSRSATIAYDHHLTAITHPGKAPDRVTEFDADGMGHSLDIAIDALDAALDLATPGAGRLLVIASDGYYSPGEAARAADRARCLHNAGCALLWLAFDPDPCPLPPATALVLTDPASAIAAIGRAATTALTTTR